MCMSASKSGTAATSTGRWRSSAFSDTTERLLLLLGPRIGRMPPHTLRRCVVSPRASELVDLAERIGEPLAPSV